MAIGHVAQSVDDCPLERLAGLFHGGDLAVAADKEIGRDLLDPVSRGEITGPWPLRMFVHMTRCLTRNRRTSGRTLLVS